MKHPKETSRRDLLFRILPACSLCLGCTGLISMAKAEEQKTQPLPLTKKALEKSDMTYDDVFKFAYLSVIQVMKSLTDQVGKDKFIEMLKKAASDAAVRETEAQLKNQPKRDLATYLADLKKPSALYEHALSFEFIKDTEKEAEVRVTECLWAKTFRQANAADIGFAMVCNPDVAAVKAFNPKIVMSRPKLLMQGDNECRFQWTVGA